MAENTLLHLKHKIESLLFSAARRISVQEIKRLTRASEEDILKCLQDYKKELEEKGGSLVLEQDGENWQLTVREKYIPVIKKVVTQTEMPKTMVETLAVVAYKAPVLQSTIIKIRTNKAYKHLDWLEKEGFLTREKKGRTKLIKLTPKFYDYFNLDPRQVKEKFKEIAVLEEQKPKFAEGVEPYTEKLGKLEVYKEKEHKKKHKHKKEKKKEEITVLEEEKPKEPKGLDITPEQEKKAEEKVKEMLGTKKEEKKEKKDEKENTAS